MPFNVDTYRIYRAIQAAGIDPDNAQQVEQFTQAIVQQLQRIPADRRANFTQKDWNRVVDLAADQIAAAPGMEELRTRGQANDPTAVWELTELGKRGRERRAATEENSAPRRPNAPTTPAGDNFTPDSGYPDGYRGNPPGTRHTMTPTGEKPTRHTMGPPNKPSKPDLDALWRQAKDEGKV